MSNISTAVEAFERGWQAVPVRTGTKAPHVSSWVHIRWKDRDEVATHFGGWRDEGVNNIGLLLGEPSAGLIDVDIDHHRATRLKHHFLPATAMRSGRQGRPDSHFWYIADGPVPSTRRYTMPDGAVSVELRSTGSQTVVPPSIHPSGDEYRWEGAPWGGEDGPAHVPSQVLAVQVSLLAMGCVLMDGWPSSGGRHEAYLALAGGLLRYGQTGVHPWWEKNLPVLIGALATASNDADGASARIGEVMGTTLAALREGKPATGFPRLAEIIGEDHAELVRRQAKTTARLAGVDEDLVKVLDDGPTLAELAAKRAEAIVGLPPEKRNPLEERLGSWEPLDMEPYLAGEIEMPKPTVLKRDDGVALFYAGRVNSLYGQSEAAKTWIALIACLQEIALGERVMYLDLEDEPSLALSRLRLLGAGDDDIRFGFSYIRPEDPLRDMQRNRWGQVNETESGRKNAELFWKSVEQRDPSLIVVDTMMVLYGLHGLDSNDGTSTDIITSWLKKLTRNGRTTVIVIDHTGRGAVRGSAPIGAHHKIAMVQGTAIQAHPIEQPMPGVRGEVELIVYKDRPGAVRKESLRKGPAVAAVVILDSTNEKRTKVSIETPDPNAVVVGDGEADQKAIQKAQEKLLRDEIARQAREAKEEIDDWLRFSIEASLDGGAVLTRAQILSELMGLRVFPDGFPESRFKAVWDALLKEEGGLCKTSNNRWAAYRWEAGNP